jgi:hypothetical protein
MKKLGLSRKSMKGFVLLAILATCNPLFASIVLNFEGIGDQSTINDFYNGGQNSSGNHGRNYGIRFSRNAVGLVDSDVNFDFSGNFAHEPSPNTVTVFRGGEAATLNVASGFDTGFSFYYSSRKRASVDIYEGQNGTGALLGSLKLKTNHNQYCNGDPNGDYCHWNAIGMRFKGKARSVVFNGPAEYTLYDNLTLGSASPGQVPVPGAFWLMGSGLFVLLKSGRRICH